MFKKFKPLAPPDKSESISESYRLIVLKSSLMVSQVLYMIVSFLWLASDSEMNARVVVPKLMTKQRNQ